MRYNKVTTTALQCDVDKEPARHAGLLMDKISNTQRKLVGSLGSARRRRDEGLFVAEGTKSVLDLLGGPFALRTVIATSHWYAEHALAPGTPCLSATTADMERMTSLSTAPQVMAVFEIPTDSGDFTPSPDALYVAVDGVQDPGNLGTILRLCDWFGVSDVLASRDTVDLFNPKCIMATMGSVARVRVHYVDLPAALDSYHDTPVWGTFLDGENIYDIPADSPRTGIIVMGNEGKGISADVARRVTRRVLIPSYPPGHAGAESLNVAMATAIVLADFRRSCT